MKPQHPPRSPSPPTSSSFSFHNLLVLVLSAVQVVSSACLALIHAYKQTLSTIKRVNNSHLQANDLSLPLGNYANTPLSMLSEIFTLQDRVASTVLLTTARLITDFSSSFIDRYILLLNSLASRSHNFLHRLMPHLLMNQLSPAFILSTTRTAKRTLFPNGYPGPPPIEPSLEEQAEIRARLVAWRPSSALGMFRVKRYHTFANRFTAARFLPLVLGPSPTHTLDAALEPLSSAPCNVHLVLFLLDCVLATLFPELAVAGTSGGGAEKSFDSSSDP